MRKKPIVLALILIIASAWIGTGFSLAADTIKLNEDLVVLVELNNVSVSDNESGIDVATPNAVLIDTHNLQVIITNGYPGYAAYIKFNITNIYDAPILLDGLNIEIDDTNALLVKLEGTVEGKFLFPGYSLVGLLSVEIQQAAVMGESYSFDIYISFSSSDQP